VSGGLALLQDFCQWNSEHQLCTVFLFFIFCVSAFIQTTCISLTPRCIILSCCYCTDKSLEQIDICISVHFKVNCEVMPLRSFANFKLIFRRNRKSCAGPPKARGPRPWPIWPMRKSVPAYGCNYCRYNHSMRLGL